MHNPALAAQRGISAEDTAQIDALHDSMSRLIELYTPDCGYESTSAIIRKGNKALSDLWGLEYDERYNVWNKKLDKKHFECTWSGRIYKCMDTGETVTIGEDLFERQLVPIGKGAIDLGVCNGYSRVIGNIVEVVF
jgi:hypothetical protein